MRNVLSKYISCVKYVLSYTASKFRAFAVVSVADLQTVSLSHTCMIYRQIGHTCRVTFLLLPSHRKKNSICCTVGVFLFDIRHYHWCAQIQVAVVSTFCTVAPDIGGSSICILLRVTIVAPRILRWLLDFWKVFESMLYHNKRYVLLEALSSLEDDIVTAFL
jgi:hypothetical protein